MKHTFEFPQGSTDELAKVLEMVRIASPVPILVYAKAHHEGAELAQAVLTEETLTDGSKVCNLTLLFV